MKIIRPMPIGDIALVASDVPETDYAAYNPATAYVTGNRVVVSTVSSIVTITAVGPAVVTQLAHGYGGGEFVSLTTTGALPIGVSVGVQYYVTNVTADAYQLALTPTGVPIATSGIQSGVHTAVVGLHRIYEALRAVTGVQPHASVADWLEIGATNRWAMFDGSVTSQTQQANSMTFSIQTVGRVDSMAFMNINATTITITGTDAIDGIVYGPTVYDMSSSAPVSDWYSYFFEPISLKSDFVDIDFPPYANLLLTITISNPGGTAAVGAVVAGMSKDLGLTQYGAQVGIIDYSNKTKDAFGNWVILERGFSKRGRFTMWIDAVNVDSIHAALAAYRAQPCVYYATTEYTSTVIYGFYKDFNIDISYPTMSICSLDVEGLT